MNDEYHITYEDVIDCVSEIFSKNCEFCKHDIKYDMDDFDDNGITIIDTYHPVGSIGYTPMQVLIGTKSLEENISHSNNVRDKDAVWTIMQAFHECAHIWQYSIGYMQKDASDLMRIMAKGRAVSVCFPEYKKSTYFMDTSELFANKYAVLQTKNFFENKAEKDIRFANIDINTIICEKEKLRHGHFWPKLRMCKTIDDVDNVYGEALQISPYIKKIDIVNISEKYKISQNFSKLLNNREVMNDIFNAQNGEEELEILCKYVGKYHPNCFRGLLCIRDEYCSQNLHGAINKITETLMGISPQKWVGRCRYGQT